MAKLISELATNEEFEKACQPVVDFLRQYGTPYSTVIINQTEADYLNGEMAVSFEPMD